MDAETFAEAMGRSLPLARYQALLPAWNLALIQAQCTTVNRVAMWCAQVGHESVGLKYMNEIASGSAYEGRKDLGNTHPGDGVRFKGHGPIQITGRANHTAVSLWAFHNGYVPTATYFIDHPAELGQDQYGFLGVVWYWTVARAALNSYADSGNIVAATSAVNGGQNGIADRRLRWQRALKLGDRLLPSNPNGDNELDANQAKQLAEVHDQLTALLTPWGGGVSDKENGEPYNLYQYILRNNVEIHRTRTELAALTATVNALVLALKNKA